MIAREITGREKEAAELVRYGRAELGLNDPQLLTALVRATSIMLDELPAEGRSVLVEGFTEILKHPGFFG
jgi:hypothetical protein